jgi:hypothetical protein
MAWQNYRRQSSQQRFRRAPSLESCGLLSELAAKETVCDPYPKFNSYVLAAASVFRHYSYVYRTTVNRADGKPLPDGRVGAAISLVGRIYKTTAGPLDGY